MSEMMEGAGSISSLGIERREKVGLPGKIWPNSTSRPPEGRAEEESGAYPGHSDRPAREKYHQQAIRKAGERHRHKVIA